MKSGSFSPLAAVLVFAFGLNFCTLVAAQQPKQNSVAAAGPLQEAARAFNAGKYDETISILQRVQALPDKTAFDEHVMNELLGVAYARTSRYAEAAQALEAGLDSGFLQPDKVPERVRALIGVYSEIKQHGKVVELGSRAIQNGDRDGRLYTWVGQAYYMAGDFKNAARFVEDHVNSMIKARNKPKEQLLRLVHDACTKVEDVACVQRSLEHLVRYYPKTEYWHSLVHATYRELSKETDQILLHVFRLKAEVDVLTQPNDYKLFAELAIDAGSPGEAERILEEGLRRNVFKEPLVLRKSKRLLDRARKDVASDRAELPRVAAQATAARSGELAVSLGLAYLGYREYNKAIDSIERGLKKPGLRNPAEARLLLGIAELGAGRKDAARKTFESVKGDPKLEQLASLWSLHAQA